MSTTPTISQSLHFLQVGEYVLVACATFLALEIISTVEQEIAYIWSSRWTPMKFIYLVNRYSPIIDAVITVTLPMRNTNKHSCAIRYQVSGYTYIVGTFFSEFIIVGRTLALYDFDPYVCIMMAALMVGLIVPPLVVAHAYFAKLKYVRIQWLRFVGCVPNSHSKMGWSLYGCILISETVVVILTIYKQWRTRTKNVKRCALVRKMYRDGTYYYLIMLMLTMGNLGPVVANLPSVELFMQMPLRVVHSTLSSRVLLNIRGAAHEKAESTLPTFQESQIVFRRPSDPSLGSGSSNLSLEETRTKIAVEMETITSYDP